MEDYLSERIVEQLRDLQKETQKLNDTIIRLDTRQQQQWEVLWAILRDVQKK